jgi:hypothetical protein
MALSPEQKRICQLEQALRGSLEMLENHRCPYCGTKQCAVTGALDVLENSK